MLTTQQKEIMIGGALIVGGLGYYYYTKNHQKTVTVTKTAHPTVISTRTNRATPTQTIVRTNRITPTHTTTKRTTSTLTHHNPVYLTSHATVHQSVSAPSAPTHLTVSHVGNNSAIITWAPVSGATSYQVVELNLKMIGYSNAFPHGEWQIAGSRIIGHVTGTTYKWSGLLEATLYRFAVVACNQYGCSSLIPSSGVLGWFTTGNPAYTSRTLRKGGYVSYRQKYGYIGDFAFTTQFRGLA